MKAAAAAAEPRPPRRPRRLLWRVVALISVVVLVVAAGAFLTYRRQIVSWLTHRKGGPEVTWPYEPYANPPLLRFAIAGDTGDAGGTLDGVSHAVTVMEDDDPYDALLLLGDLVYPAGDPTQLQQVVFDPFADVLADGTELLAVLGNHDVKSGQGDTIMAELGMPGDYWAHEYGDVLFVGLDTTAMDDPAQLEFLEQALSTTTATWRIVLMHHPPYSAGYQGSNTTARERFTPIFERYGVQLVLSGHDHDYQRSTPINGVTYIVSGGGSGTRGTSTESFTAVAYAWPHFTELAVFPDRLVLRAIGTDTTVADEYTIPLAS